MRNRNTNEAPFIDYEEFAGKLDVADEIAKHNAAVNHEQAAQIIDQYLEKKLEST